MVRVFGKLNLKNDFSGALICEFFPTVLLWCFGAGVHIASAAQSLSPRIVRLLACGRLRLSSGRRKDVSEWGSLKQLRQRAWWWASFWVQAFWAGSCAPHTSQPQQQGRVGGNDLEEDGAYGKRMEWEFPWLPSGEREHAPGQSEEGKEFAFWNTPLCF